MDGFSWDPRKAGANRRRHGVDFADATSVFEDEQALTVRDEIRAVDEPRLRTLGRDLLGRLLVVTWAWRGERIRLISARRATRSERRPYREWGG
jgi:uncharacterized DUF497 family protein